MITRFLVFLTLQLIISHRTVAGQNADTNDSIRLVNYFQSALVNLEKRDSFLELTKSISNSNQHQTVLQDTYLYNLSKFLFLTGQLDSSFSTANQGLRLYQHNPLNYKASKFQNLLGSVYALKKDYERAILHFQYAVKILEQANDLHGVALIENNIANIFFSLSDYESAYKYSHSAFTTLSNEQDSLYTPLLAGIAAMSSIKLGLLEEGKVLTEICLSLSNKYNNSHAEIVGITCQGELLLEKNELDSALSYYQKALDLSESTHQPHMSILNKINLLTTFVRLNNFNQAIYYGERALTESAAIGNQNTYYSIKKNLAYAYYGVNKFQLAYEFLNEAHELYKESSGIQNKKVINDILIKYDTEKKEKELTKKKLELSTNEIKLANRKFWIITLIAGLIVLVIFYFAYYIFQKQKLKRLQEEQLTRSLLASIEGEERERERFSAELHDGIASTISAIKIQLENQNTTLNDKKLAILVDQLAQLQHETRRISHNMLPISLMHVSLEKAIENYCNENNSDKFKLVFIINTQLPINIAKTDQLVLYRAIQELVHNAQKHSNSSICYVQLSNTDGRHVISIEDEGSGFDTNMIIHFSGIQSLKKRLASINAVLEIESQLNHGTVAYIYLN